jgi:flagellar basal body-associated protein FliL
MLGTAAVADNKKEKGVNKSFIIIPIVGGIGALTLVICAYLLWRRSSARHRGKFSLFLFLS